MKTLSIASIIVSVSLILMLANQTFAETIIRFATIAPEGSTWMNSMRSLDQEVRKATNNEISFRFYPNNSMGDERDVIRKIRLGQLQAAGFTGRGLGEIASDTRILELPYLFKNDEELDFIVQEMQDHFYTQYENEGFILLGWAEVGWVYFFSNTPVCEPKDLNKTKVWMWSGDPLAQTFFHILEKSPTVLPITEVSLALQTGMIDAVYSSALGALALQWFTKVKMVSDVPFTNAIGAVLLDKKTFDKLKPEHQKILLEISKRNLRELTLQSRKDNSEAYNILLKQGLNASVSTDIQRDKMRNLGMKVHQNLAGELYSKELLDHVYELLAKHRTKR